MTRPRLASCDNCGATPGTHYQAGIYLCPKCRPAMADEPTMTVAELRQLLVRCPPNAKVLLCVLGDLIYVDDVYQASRTEIHIMGADETT